jgi:SAM-dependent methyltransferase
VSAPDRPRQFGNFEANIRFLEATGVVFVSPPAATNLRGDLRTPGPQSTPGNPPRDLGRPGVERSATGQQVLEIGTGTGAMLHALLERGCRAQGVELRQDLIDEAKRWYGDLPVQRVDGVTLPFPDGAFDAVISLDVFEHIADSDAHLDEVARVLRPGGSYLLQTPNKWMNAVFETVRWRSLKWRADHCSLHTLGQLRRRLDRHGFAVRVYDVPVVNEFFREKVRRYAGPIGAAALRVVNPDRLPAAWRTNLYVQAVKAAR